MLNSPLPKTFTLSFKVASLAVPGQGCRHRSACQDLS
jgi:hypothetical protein